MLDNQGREFFFKEVGKQRGKKKGEEVRVCFAEGDDYTRNNYERDRKYV